MADPSNAGRAERRLGGSILKRPTDTVSGKGAATPRTARVIKIDLTSTAYASVVTNHLRVETLVFPELDDKDQTIAGIQTIAHALKDNDWALEAHVPKTTKK